MQNKPNPTISRRRTPALFWGIVGAFVLLAMIPTVWTEWDIRSAAMFIGPGGHPEIAQWWWVELINLYVPALFRTIVFVALGAWIWVSVRPGRTNWRLPLAFVVLAGALGPGLLVNTGFKENWQRARPYQVEVFGGSQQFSRATVMSDQCNNNCSFVSGHVACGFFLASLLLVDRKRRVLWATAGVVSGITIGFARMADGAHWLSDVLWAGPIILLCSWLVWKLLLRLYPT